MKKIILIIAAALTLVISSSCEDFLNPKQVDLIYNDVFWQTQTDAEVGLSGAYALYRALMVNSDNWYGRADATTGLVRRGWNGGSASQLYTEGIYGDISSDQKMWGSTSVESFAEWANFYKVIAQLNMVIAKTNEIPEKNFEKGGKTRILGEAYFLRALTYFNIMRIWGNAPYVGEMIESSNQVIDADLSPVLIGRTDDFLIGQYVLADLKIAVENLEFAKFGTDKWGIFADKGAALALTGHVNLWMNFLAKRDKDPNPEIYVTNAITALEAFKEGFNGGYVPYTTATGELNHEGVKNMYFGQSLEAVFELNISVDQNESYRADGGGITAKTCKMTPFNEDPTKDRSTQIDWVPYSQKPNFYPEYDFETKTGDIRPHLFFGAWDSEYNEAVNDIQGSTTGDRNKVTWLKKYAMFSEDTYRKWDEYVAYFATANIPVFRYTDIMLLLAEAYCKNGDENLALPIVNEIRNRAGIGDWSGQGKLVKEVMQQRVSELFGEGHLYYDFVRNNYWPNDNLMLPAKYKQEGYYWPVSSTILATNKKIDQTPYWSGKTKW